MHAAAPSPSPPPVPASTTPSHFANSPPSFSSRDARYFAHSRLHSDSSQDSPPVHPYRHSFIEFAELPDDYQIDDLLHNNTTSLQRSKPAARIVKRPAFSRALTVSTEVDYMANDSSLALDPIPGSPPELSSSRSSVKSASLQSSPSTDDLSDSSHFEEISLTDSHPLQTTPAKPLGVKPRPILRMAYTMAPTPTPNRTARTPTNLRDITNDLRATAALNNHAQKHSPRAGWQRTFQPSGATLTTPLKSGSRTPSPTKSPVLETSPSSAGNPTPRPGGENSPILPSSRRGSSQPPKKKTAKELEMEYHDSDDDLPDDMCMWNVPLSPRPITSRSPSVSPERGSLQPRSGDRGFRFSRTKTWAAALQELSEDAQKLTVALEQHFDSQLQQTSSSPVSSTTSSPRPPLHHRAKTVSALPAMQPAHHLLEPIPVSKEKERYLSRTRPSWLPPKCPKEEAKHLKEYEKMMSSIAASG